MMCGFVGIANLKDNILSFSNILKEMNQTLSKKGPDKEGYFKDEHILLAIKKSMDVNCEAQPLIAKIHDNTYSIVYNGQLYNINELRQELIENDFDFEGHSDTEVLLKAFIHYGYDVVSHLNGIFGFAIWNNNKQELFLARDHFGIKPLYYSVLENHLLFSSEVKAILKFPNFPKTVSKQGICELIGLGPAHTPGTTIFDNIFELKPASYAIYNKDGLHIEKYWKLNSCAHKDDFNTTCNNVKSLLEDSIQGQLASDRPLCTFLSGGLDSSIITTYASKLYKSNKQKCLNTYSVDYIDNDKNFVKSDFQPNSDKYYIDIMTNLLRNKPSYHIY